MNYTFKAPIFRAYELRGNKGDFFGNNYRLKKDSSILIGDKRIGFIKGNSIIQKVRDKLFTGLRNGEQLHLDLTEENPSNIVLRYILSLGVKRGDIYYFVTARKEDESVCSDPLRGIDTFSLTPPSDRYVIKSKVLFTFKTPSNTF